MSYVRGTQFFFVVRGPKNRGRSYAFLGTQWFVPVCIKYYSCIWLGIKLFDSKHLYNNVLLLTCSISYFVFILWFYGTLNKISISVKNEDQYKSNQEVHSTNTRYSTNLHPPVSNLAAFQRGAYYFGIKVVRHLPSTIISLYNERNYLDLPLKDLFSLINFVPQMINLTATTIN